MVDVFAVPPLKLQQAIVYIQFSKERNQENVAYIFAQDESIDLFSHCTGGLYECYFLARNNINASLGGALSL